MLFNEIANRSSLAVVWKRLLEAPKKDFDSIVKYLYPLVTNPAFLAAPEVVVACGNVLEHLYAANALTPAQKLALEESILAIPTVQIIRRYDRPESLVNRLLSRIPRNSIVTEAARKALDALAEKGEPVVNRPYVRTTFGQRPITDEDWLKDQGAKLDDPE